MDIRDTLRLGDRLDVKLGDDQYRTKVVALESATVFVVVYLGDEPIPDEYGADAMVGITSYHSNGKDEFKGRIAYRGFKFSNMPALRIEAVSEISKTQRRDSFRLPVSFDVEYFVLSKETKTVDRTPHAAVSVDVGEGGMLIRSKEGYAVDTEFELCFSIDGRDVAIGGIVRRSDFDVTSEGSLEFIMGLQFTAGSIDIKQHIAKFVMQYQIRSRKRVKL